MSDTETVDKVLENPKTRTVDKVIEPVKNTKRKITDMSVEEKNVIIAEIVNGKENEHYHVKQFKNGTYRLVNKPKKTMLQEAAAAVPTCSKQPILSNDQWMIQNMMDMKSENAIMKKKLEKYKKRLNELYFVMDDDEVGTPVLAQEQQNPEHTTENIENIPPQPVRYVSRHLVRRR